MKENNNILHGLSLPISISFSDGEVPYTTFAGKQTSDPKKIIEYIGKRGLLNFGNLTLADVELSSTDDLSIGIIAVRDMIDVDLLKKARLRITMELNAIKITCKAAAALQKGSIIKLPMHCMEAMSLFAGDQIVAKGTAVVYDDTFGIRINELLSRPMKPETFTIFDAEPMLMIRPVLGAAELTLDDLLSLSIDSAIFFEQKVIEPLTFTLFDHKFLYEVIVVDETIALRIIYKVDILCDDVNDADVNDADVNDADDTDGAEDQKNCSGDASNESIINTEKTENNNLSSTEALIALLKSQPDNTVESKPFECLDTIDTKLILDFLQDEHPQTIALILSQLEAQKAAHLLSAMPSEIRTEVTFRISTLDRVAPYIIREIERVLERILLTLSSEELINHGGIDFASDVLELTDENVRNTILKGIEDRDAEVARKLKL